MKTPTSGDVRLPVEWNFPLSGAVTQSINLPFANGFNINLGASNDAALEQKIIAQAGSYGKQLGRICDVITVMLTHLEAGTKLPATDPAVTAFKNLATLVTATKKEHRP